MPQIRRKLSRTVLSGIIPIFILLSAALILHTGTIPARAQAFADLKTALVDYSKADMEPGKDCEALSEFKSKEIVQITAATIPATAAVPAYCRVTGLLDPEIAFEVSLPAKWNGRFYMIGNGGHAGEALDDARPRLAAQRMPCRSDSPSRRRIRATTRARSRARPLC